MAIEDLNFPAFNLNSAVGEMAGRDTALASYVGPYVTNMLGRGAALGDIPYTPYEGQLTAGTSPLQQQAFQGLANLVVPTEEAGAYKPQSFIDEGVAQQYMNPYLQAALNPQLEEARRQADISAMQNRGRLTRAGAFGGSRQAIMDTEADRNLQQNLASITGQGYATAYDRAANLFSDEQSRKRQGQLDVNQYIQNVLEAQAAGGAQQRGIESEGIAADIRQFETERDFPYQQLKFQQGLLSGLPTTSYAVPYVQPSDYQTTMSGAGDILEIIKGLYKG